ncbi:cysteine desulfuration protein SufE [Galdieria sulphuraria]|uniref:Cysteine desulfuration protein SufE (Plastid) n=1 Tax=Galdieria sulphuraria TaxID=130081 RepID=M2XAG5_GALSU|nr:cysteine desulfuration protein SufE [Galdieria sulphuraria]EME26852.1 cysteine desulfuration protein SufE [Galdieria sulphuraria]|eukprot:XP_005703372.1 cysteine desulfuration protein SufE [Galdieria sulphuraria]
MRMGHFDRMISHLDCLWVTSPVEANFYRLAYTRQGREPNCCFHNKKRLHFPKSTFRLQIRCQVDEKKLGLTPELARLVKSFAAAPDPKLRVQQLLYLAQTLEPLPFQYKTNENKVPGCLSTVHVVGDCDNEKIFFKGDSDAQLTKGLLALLIKGLNGCTVEEIERISPEFVTVAGLSVSLTPGRNNGFLNMLQTMKNKAKEAASKLNGVSREGRNYSDRVPKTQASPSTAETASGPIYSAIVEKLQKLKPSRLEVHDDSFQHAGHVGAKGLRSSETHFSVYVVSDAFVGLSLVKRHQLVYTLLGQELKEGLHALRIQAKTPSEVSDE